MAGGLCRAGQSKTLAAGILGIHPTSLRRRLKQQHLDNWRSHQAPDSDSIESAVYVTNPGMPAVPVKLFHVEQFAECSTRNCIAISNTSGPRPGVNKSAWAGKILGRAGDGVSALVYFPA